MAKLGTLVLYAAVFVCAAFVIHLIQVSYLWINVLDSFALTEGDALRAVVAKNTYGIKNALRSPIEVRYDGTQIGFCMAVKYPPMKNIVKEHIRPYVLGIAMRQMCTSFNSMNLAGHGAVVFFHDKTDHVAVVKNVRDPSSTHYDAPLFVNVSGIAQDGSLRSQRNHTFGEWYMCPGDSYGYGFVTWMFTAIFASIVTWVTISAWNPTPLCAHCARGANAPATGLGVSR